MFRLAKQGCGLLKDAREILRHGYMIFMVLIVLVHHHNYGCRNPMKISLLRQVKSMGLIRLTSWQPKATTV
jgi:hypothetical protein